MWSHDNYYVDTMSQWPDIQNNTSTNIFQENIFSLHSLTYFCPCVRRVLVRDVPDEKLMKKLDNSSSTLNGGIDAAVSAAAAQLYYDAERQITILVIIWPFCILFVLLFRFFNG